MHGIFHIHDMMSVLHIFATDLSVTEYFHQLFSVR